MTPMYLLQIVHADEPHHVVVRGPAGSHLPLEIDMRARIVAAVVKRGVGFFKTEGQVRTAIEEGITEALMELKAQTVGVTG